MKITAALAIVALIAAATPTEAGCKGSGCKKDKKQSKPAPAPAAPPAYAYPQPYTGYGPPPPGCVLMYMPAQPYAPQGYPGAGAQPQQVPTYMCPPQPQPQQQPYPQQPQQQPYPQQQQQQQPTLYAVDPQSAAQYQKPGKDEYVKVSMNVVNGGKPQQQMRPAPSSYPPQQPQQYTPQQYTPQQYAPQQPQYVPQPVYYYYPAGRAASDYEMGYRDASRCRCTDAECCLGAGVVAAATACCLTALLV